MLKRLSTGVATLLVAGSALVACVDAKKRFDEFDDRVPTVDASLIDRPTTPIANVDGTFYLAIKAVNFNNTLHLFVTWDITVNGATGTLSGTYQPLSAPSDGSPPPRLPVGPPLTGNNAMVDDTASFVAPIAGTFDGTANPISGSPLGSQVSLIGTIKSTDLVCGTVLGTVCLGADAPCSPGVSVEPATFAAVRVTDVNSLPPLPPTDRCPE